MAAGGVLKKHNLEAWASRQAIVTGRRERGISAETMSNAHVH